MELGPLGPWLTPAERKEILANEARGIVAAQPWGIFKRGDSVRLSDDPTKVGVVVNGLREYLRDPFYTKTPSNIDRIATYGYVLRIRWGTDSDSERAEHVKKIGRGG